MSHLFISSRNMSLYISIPDLDTAYAPVCLMGTRPKTEQEALLLQKDARHDCH